MFAIIRRLLLGLIWASAGYAVLQVHRFDLGLGYNICGAWGCGPPVEALISCHGFWLILVVPGMLLLGRWLPINIGRSIGAFTAVVGLMLVLGYVGWDLKQFFARGQFTQYWLQRAGFAFITWTDYPFWQVAMGGMVMVVQQRFRARGLVASAIDVNDSSQSPETIAATV